MAASLADRITQSELLHLRVRSFATHALQARTSQQQLATFPPSPDSFIDLAADIAAFQSGVRPNDLSQLVSRAVPSDCFKFGEVFQFPRMLATHAFRTSGTTASNTGVHLMRSAHTYEHLSLSWGGLALGLESKPSPIVVALAPWTGRDTGSSLGYMMQRMMERFDGKSLSPHRLDSGFELDDPSRWLVSERGINVRGLERIAEVAFAAKTRVVLLATSFALVELLDVLGGATLLLPDGSVIMPTGGFKGRTRTILPEMMGRELQQIFGDVDLVGEYGMTELSSQLYEGTCRVGALVAAPGVYLEPPWLRVVPCCPQSLKPAAKGEVGLACFVDLGNVDSALAVLTQDLVRREDNGIRLLGRQPAAPLRGCSLAVEALLHPLGSESRKVEVAHVPPHAAEHSSGTREASIRRVQRLIAHTARCQQELLRDESRLLQLASSAFMSVPGVKLALSLALETNPTSQEVETLVERASLLHSSQGDERPTVWVVLSSTVFTAAHRAAALALSISPRVKLKPSRRQPHFVAELARACGGLFEVVNEVAPVAGDIVLAFGSDETIEALGKTVPQGTHLRGYGHGMGVAVVGKGANTESSVKGLALDMVLFEQQGCLSPRVLLVDSSCDVEALKLRLMDELAAWGTSVPMADVAPEHVAHAAWEYRVATHLATVSGPGPVCLAEYAEGWVKDHRLPLFQSPRRISVVRSSEPLTMLNSIANLVTCVGYSGDEVLAQALELKLPHARRVPLGTMQRPRFDGPVDLRPQT